MVVLVFRTNIKSKKKVKIIKPVLNNNEEILNWNIDLEDIDNVLRIEAIKTLEEQAVIGMIRDQGFYIEALKD